MCTYSPFPPCSVSDSDLNMTQNRVSWGPGVRKVRILRNRQVERDLDSKKGQRKKQVYLDTSVTRVHVTTTDTKNFSPTLRVSCTTVQPSKGRTSRCGSLLFEEATRSKQERDRLGYPRLEDPRHPDTHDRVRETDGRGTDPKDPVDRRTSFRSP